MRRWTEEKTYSERIKGWIDEKMKWWTYELLLKGWNDEHMKGWTDKRIKRCTD